MSFNIELTEQFKKEAKRLAKKYPSLKNDLQTLGEQLLDNPTIGITLGHDVYKIRMPIASKRKGKSGGARVITFVRIVNETIYLVTIYDKGELENLTKDDILAILKKTGLV